MRILTILLAVLWALSGCAEVWAEYGDWATPFTWLIWLVPVPVVCGQPNTCEVSRFFQPIVVEKQS